MVSVRLTTLLAVQRRALIRVDNATRSGNGSQVGALNGRTKAACQSLLASGLLEAHTTSGGQLWYRTTPSGRTLREEGAV